MATTYHNVKGRIKWPKVYEPDEYAGAKRYMINFYPFDGSEWEKVQKSGIQSSVKEDADGKYIVLRRPASKLINEDLVIFCPPEITGVVNVHYVGKDGAKVRSYTKGDNTAERVGDPVGLGNGTVVIANFCVYDTRQGKGGRLENLKVIDLVAFEPEAKPVPEEDVVDEDIQVGEEKDEKAPW